METIVIKVKYKSRFTGLTLELTNPSTSHVKRLHLAGHDLAIHTWIKGKLFSSQFLKY